jgi:hypothetical protein
MARKGSVKHGSLSQIANREMVDGQLGHSVI